MQIGEARMSALIVAALTGVILTILLAQAFRSVTMALSMSLPVAGVMGLVMFFMASDRVKKGGEKPPQETKPTEGE
jgi:hypothetical protein